MSDLPQRYGPWAVVAGAAMGIGAEFCGQLATAGHNLVMVALESDELEALASDLRDAHGVAAVTVTTDLGTPEGLAEVVAAADGLEVGLLVYNAALSSTAPWLATDLERNLGMVDVNVRGPMVLLDAFVPAMVERGRGGVVLLSSMSSLTGTPLVATYAATKAFTRILAESLWEELGAHGVDVLAVIPGTVDTPGFRASAPRLGRMTQPMSVGPVVAQALAALGRQPTVIPGGANRVAGTLMERVLPRKLALRFMGRTMRAMYGDD